MSGSSSSLAEQSANRIADMILEEKRFQEGDKLPNEMELAELLSVSRVTLREAIRILCTRGLVEIRRGPGYLCDFCRDRLRQPGYSGSQRRGEQRP